MLLAFYLADLNHNNETLFLQVLPDTYKVDIKNSINFPELAFIAIEYLYRMFAKS